MKILFFYTFNYIAGHQIELNFLKLSIYSLYKELNDQVDIRIYTETDQILREKINFPIKIIKINSQTYREKFNILYQDGHFNGLLSRFDFIGCSRIPLLKEILEEKTYDIIVYLDNDTFLCRSYGKIFIEELTKIEEPHLCFQEPDDIHHWFNYQNRQKPFNTDLIKTHRYKTHNSKSILNDGIIAIKDNSVCRKFVDLSIDILIYCYQTFGPLYGADQSAIDFAFYECEFSTNNTFEKNDKLMPLFHYFYQKNKLKRKIKNFPHINKNSDHNYKKISIEYLREHYRFVHYYINNRHLKKLFESIVPIM